MIKSDEQVVYTGLGTSKILGKPLKNDASKEEKELISTLRNLIEYGRSYKPAGEFSEKLNIVSKGLRKFPERKDEAAKVLFGIYLTSGEPKADGSKEPHYVNARSQIILTTFPEVKLVAGIYESGPGKEPQRMKKRIAETFGLESSITQAYEGISKTGGEKQDRERFKKDIYTR
jgi:hypothetical protein